MGQGTHCGWLDWLLSLSLEATLQGAAQKRGLPWGCVGWHKCWCSGPGQLPDAPAVGPRWGAPRRRVSDAERGLFQQVRAGRVHRAMLFMVGTVVRGVFPERGTQRSPWPNWLSLGRRGHFSETWWGGSRQDQGAAVGVLEGFDSGENSAPFGDRAGSAHLLWWGFGFFSSCLRSAVMFSKMGIVQKLGHWEWGVLGGWDAVLDSGSALGSGVWKAPPTPHLSVPACTHETKSPRAPARSKLRI